MRGSVRSCFQLVPAKHSGSTAFVMSSVKCSTFNSPLIWTTTPHTLSLALIAKREESVVPGVVVRPLWNMIWWAVFRNDVYYLGNLYVRTKSCIGGRLFIELYRVLDVYVCLCFYTRPRARTLIMI